MHAQLIDDPVVRPPVTIDVPGFIDCRGTWQSLALAVPEDASC